MFKEVLSNLRQNLRNHLICSVWNREGFRGVGHVFQGSGVGEELGKEFG
jgi:hypothetical protein